MRKDLEYFHQNLIYCNDRLSRPCNPWIAHASEEWLTFMHGIIVGGFVEHLYDERGDLWFLYYAADHVGGFEMYDAHYSNIIVSLANHDGDYHRFQIAVETQRPVEYVFVEDFQIHNMEDVKKVCKILEPYIRRYEYEEEARLWRGLTNFS